MNRISVIGLGNMGGNMASVLMEKGCEVYVLDVDSQKQSRLVSRGGIPLSSAIEAVEKADTVILSLPNDDIMGAVMGELLAHDLTGKTIIDTTSAKYTTALEIAERVKAKNGQFLDAPVTGGEKGAREGTLTFMVGGDQAALEQSLHILQSLGTRIVHIGPSGHGQIAKMVNQEIMAAIYVSVTEAFAFAAERGVDIERVYDAVENGGAKSQLLSAMRNTILSGEPVLNHNLAIHGKDVDYVMDEANRLKSFMPVNASVQQVMNMARQKGLSDHWSGSIFVMWEELIGKKLNSAITGGTQ